MTLHDVAPPDVARLLEKLCGHGFLVARQLNSIAHLQGMFLRPQFSTGFKTAPNPVKFHLPRISQNNICFSLLQCPVGGESLHPNIWCGYMIWLHEWPQIKLNGVIPNCVHSLELTWKWRMAPWKIIFHYKQVDFHFQVSFRESGFLITSKVAQLVDLRGVSIRRLLARPQCPSHCVGIF